MEISLKPVAFVKNSRSTPIDDHWEAVLSEIVLVDEISSEAFLNMDGFSHLEILYYFDRVPDHDIVLAGYPRGNKAYPFTGIFGQRKKDRPNRLGLCSVELLKVNERSLTVRRLDAIDGTPVLDIKPVFKEFLPVGPILQPAWTVDLMKEYWV
jgi:tRNA (adenine37-N6)-methyltransferase